MVDLAVPAHPHVSNQLSSLTHVRVVADRRYPSVKTVEHHCLQSLCPLPARSQPFAKPDSTPVAWRAVARACLHKIIQFLPMKFIDPPGYNCIHNHILLRNERFDINQKSTIHCIQAHNQEFTLPPFQQAHQVKAEPVRPQMGARCEYAYQREILSVPGMPLQKQLSPEMEPGDHEQMREFLKPL